VRILTRALADPGGPARDVVLLNAGAAIYTGGLAPSLAEGLGVAEEVIQQGGAMAKLTELVEFSQALAKEGSGA